MWAPVADSGRAEDGSPKSATALQLREIRGIPSGRQSSPAQASSGGCNEPDSRRVAWPLPLPTGFRASVGPRLLAFVVHVCQTHRARNTRGLCAQRRAETKSRGNSFIGLGGGLCGGRDVRRARAVGVSWRRRFLCQAIRRCRSRDPRAAHEGVHPRDGVLCIPGGLGVHLGPLVMPLVIARASDAVSVAVHDHPFPRSLDETKRRKLRLGACAQATEMQTKKGAGVCELCGTWKEATVPKPTAMRRRSIVELKWTVVPARRRKPDSSSGRLRRF